MEDKNSVVKVDSELLKKIEELVKREKFTYSSKKQAIDIAILEFLNKHGFKIGRKKR